MIDPIANKQVFLAVVVHVPNQRPPTPIGGFHSGDGRDFRKGIVLVVELQGVLHKLVIKSFFLLYSIDVKPFKLCCFFKSGVFTRQHVGDKNFGKPIVVDIGHIRTHGGMTNVVENVLNVFFECPIALVDVEIIPLIKIIGDVDIDVTVFVDIAQSNPKTESNKAAIYARTIGHVRKDSSVVLQ